MWGIVMLHRSSLAICDPLMVRSISFKESPSYVENVRWFLPRSLKIDGKVCRPSFWVPRIISKDDGFTEETGHIGDVHSVVSGRVVFTSELTESSAPSLSISSLPFAFGSSESEVDAMPLGLTDG